MVAVSDTKTERNARKPTETSYVSGKIYVPFCAHPYL